MNKEYLERNAKGYEGDEYIHKEIAKLVKKFKINLIVETGTYRGATTKRLSEFCHVISSEVVKQNYDYAVNFCKDANVTLNLKDSVELLKELDYTDKNVLFFLDAHWWDVCPLLEELDVIAAKGLKPVIVIHDFKVPGTDFGYDSYKGQDFTFEWIEPKLKSIYGKFKYHYNSQADGAKRGVIYIYPEGSNKSA